MPERFNADEIFEIAEQIERNGAKFYRRAAEFAKGAEPKALLLELAAMEGRHERTFAGLRAELWQKDPGWLSTAFDAESDNQVTLYLQAVAEGRVFDLKGGTAALLAGNESLKDILEIAIGLEKDSVVFYVGIKEAVPKALGGDKIDQIIREEMGHIASLTNHLAGLQA